MPKTGRVTLPDPDTKTLTRPPLELVVCQLRHEDLSQTRDASAALRVQKRLSDPYPTLTQGEVAELVVEAWERGVQSSSSGRRNGWQLKSPDEAWTAVIMPDFIALESRGYTTWTEFHRRLTDLLSAVCEDTTPALMQRLGLRYIDRLQGEELREPPDWIGRIDAGLLGLASNDEVGSAVQAAQTVNQLVIGELQVLLRSSCATDGGTPSGYSTVLDTDCFDAKAREFDLQDVKATLQSLHRTSLQLFQLCLSSDFLKELRD